MIDNLLLESKSSDDYYKLERIVELFKESFESRKIKYQVKIKSKMGRRSWFTGIISVIQP